jgi:hypothetical protein
MRFLAVILYVIGGVMLFRMVRGVENLSRWDWSLLGAATSLIDMVIACMIIFLGGHLLATARAHRAFTRDPDNVVSLKIAFLRQKIYLRLMTILLLIFITGIVASAAFVTILARTNLLD